MGKECPSPAALEAMALGAGPEPGSRTHVSRCEACRTAIEEIRANQAFLGLAGTALADAADSVRAAVPRPAPAPDSVRGFTLLEEISRGGQGVVYRAVQIATKRPAAVKMLLGGAFASERQRQRFEREIEIAARLRHPNIVSVFESGLTADGTPYVAMEYVEGIALDRYAESKLGYPGKSDRPRVDAVMRLLGAIASGVGHAHTAGVIHRDLKPSNILVDGSGNARVLDFGLARATDRAHDVSTTREFVGTPAYASPEQLGGDPASVNARTDVYALGLVLYRLLTHRHPYPCEGSLAELARHAIGTEPTPPSRHLTRLPSDVETIVLKCLAKDPARRYANASALASDIDDYLNGRPISARRDSTMYVLQRLALKHRVPALAVVAVAITLIGATVGLALLARDLDQARREAETSLAESNVQRARLLATAGNPEQAERLIWSNRFGAAPIAENAALFAGSPDSIRDTWTLAEIYAFSPCVLRVEPGRRFFAVGFLPDQRSFWAIDGEGARWTWSPVGELIARTRPVCPEIQIDEAITCHDGRTVLVVRRESLELFDVDDPASRRVLQTPATQRYWHLDPLAQLIASTDRVTEGEIDVHRASDLTPIARIPVRASSLMWAMNGGEPVLLVAVMADNDPRIEMRVPNEWQVARTLRPVEGVPAAHLPPFRNMILSPDGATLVTSLNEGLYLADARDGGDAATRLMLSRGHLHTVRYSPSGQLLYTLSMDGVLGLASPADTRVLRNVVTGCSPRVADFSEQSMTALIAPTTGGILQYRLDDRQWLRRMPTSDLTTSCVDISINGDVAWGDDRGEVRVLPGGSESGAFTFVAHHTDGGDRASVNSLRFSPDGSRFVTSGIEGSVREWSIDGRPLRVLIERMPKAWSAVYAPSGDAIAAGFSDGSIRVWREGASEPLVVHPPGMHRVPSLAFSPDGSRVVVGTTRLQPIVVDARTGGIVATLSGHEGGTRAVAWSPDGRSIITGCDDRKIRFWNAQTYELERTVAGLPWGPFQFRFHPSGVVLFAVGRGRELLAIDPSRGLELARFPLFDRLPFDIALSVDGARLLVVGQSDFVGVLEFDQLEAPIRGNHDWWRRVMALEGALPDAGGAGP